MKKIDVDEDSHVVVLSKREYDIIDRMLFLAYSAWREDDKEHDIVYNLYMDW